jgi:hypothetical protein
MDGDLFGLRVNESPTIWHLEHFILATVVSGLTLYVTATLHLITENLRNCSPTGMCNRLPSLENWLLGQDFTNSFYRRRLTLSFVTVTINQQMI